MLAFLPLSIAGSLFLAAKLFAQQRDEPATRESLKVSIFFNTNKVMGLEEIRTNAISVLRTNGHIVPQSAECVVNVSVQGKRPGCAVMFFDQSNNWQYLVVFGGEGQVLEVNGDERRHGIVKPNHPRPKVPEGGIFVRPPPN